MPLEPEVPAATLELNAVEVGCDTSPSATTRAACGGSLIGGTKALDAQVG
jgi:hypothetical protein